MKSAAQGENFPQHPVMKNRYGGSISKLKRKTVFNSKRGMIKSADKSLKGGNK